MARIAGVDIPREKRVDVSLRYIFGIGPTAAKHVLEQARVDGAIRVRDLTEPQVAKIRDLIDRSFTVEGDLLREVGMNSKRLQDVGRAAVFRSAASARARTRARARVRARRSPARRSRCRRRDREDREVTEGPTAETSERAA